MINPKNILPGEMKNNIKCWFSFLKLKKQYSSFLKNYKKTYVSSHEFSNKVWVCWLQGEEKAPDLVKKCIESMRNKFNNKEIIVLTDLNISEYTKFPSFIIEKYKAGKISRTHFSDLLRLELLSNHGGLWIDSTCLVTEWPEYIENEPLFVFNNRGRADNSIAASSWFISCEKNNPIITLTKEILYDYWKKNNKLCHYFLMHFFFTLATEFYSEDWKKVPFYSNLPCHVLQRELFEPFNEKRFEQIKKMSAIHKLTYKSSDKNLSGTFYEKILKGNI